LFAARFTTSMSKLITVSVATIAVVCAGGGYYWLHSSRLSEPISGPVPSAVSEPVVNAAAVPTGPSLPKANQPHDGAVSPDAGSPLHPGEVLDFAADVSKLSNVANLRLQIVERRNFFGKNAWHLQAFAHTENPLRMMFELDDQFDSYSDAVTLASLQYEMHLSERGEKQESIQRMKAGNSERAATNVMETRVAPGTRDPLGLMQYLRTVDWTKTREIRGPVYDGHKLYDVTAKYIGPAQNITVPAGVFSASQIEIRVFDNGAELKDAHFALYLASNPARTPVLLEAVMPFANARVALVKMK